MAAPVRISPIDEGVFEVAIDDGRGANRLTDEVCLALSRALDAVANDGSARVALLAGRDDVFCSGAGLDSLERLVQGVEPRKHLNLVRELLHFPLPLIGALRGHAVGGGLALALCCDILVAAAESRYGLNFSDLGFTPGMGTTWLLPSLTNHVIASELLFTGQLRLGRELESSGLFNRVVSQTEVVGVARDLALSIRDKPRPVLEMLKESLSLPRRRALEGALAHERLMRTLSFADPAIASILDDRYLR